MVLFSIEERKGGRVFLSGVRNFFDHVLEETTYRFSHVSLQFGSGVFRLLFHYIVHICIGGVLWVLRSLEAFFHHLQYRNRQSAKSVRPKEDKTHLDLIAEHKEQIALSDSEKQKRKDDAIKG